MKKLFQILGVVFLLLVLAAVAAIPLAKKKNVALTKEAQEYLEETMPKVFSNWNPTELFNRASPEFKGAMRFDEVYQLFRRASVLGPMEKFGPPRGDVAFFVDFKRGKMISGSFAITAEFGRGEAEITLGLVKHGDRWEIQNFNIQSPDFARLSSQVPAPNPKSPAPASPEESQREAVARFPDLGVADSRLNVEFVARHKRYQKERPEYFKDSSWPLRLAEESAQAIEGR